MTMAEAITQRLPAPSCELGEGPHYDHATATAWWFDILGCKLLEHRFASGITEIHDLPRMGSVVAKIDAGHQLLAMDDGLYLRKMAGGAVTLDGDQVLLRGQLDEHGIQFRRAAAEGHVHE